MIDWNQLSRIPLKAELYDRETYFREALSQAERLLGGRAKSVLHRSALMMIKPDGLISGKAPQIIDFLREHDLEIVAVRGFTMHRLQWRELWRYQLTASTLDRLMVNDLVFANPCLMLCLRDVSEAALPATVRLSVLKGPSDVSQQTPDCLRSRMAQPNRVFSLFHVADEPADLLRELAIFLDTADRAAVFDALARGVLADAERRLLEATVAESVRAPRSLDAHQALVRARQAFDGRAASLDATDRDRIEADLNAMAAGRRIAWHPFARALAACDLGLDPWDLTILGASFIVYDDPGASKQIVAAGQSPWLDAAPASG